MTTEPTKFPKAKNPFRKVCCLIVLLLFGALVFSLTSCSHSRPIRKKKRSLKNWEDHSWKEVNRSPKGSSENWIAYSMKRNSTKFKAFKIRGIVSAPPSQAVHALRYRIENWSQFYDEKQAYFKVLESSSSNLLVYSLLKLPFPFRDRSMCERFSISQDLSSGIHTITWDQEWEHAPSDDKSIRMPLAKGSWVFEPIDSSRCWATYQVFTEPGGRLPAWMYNSTVQKGLSKELRDIEEIVNKLFELYDVAE